MIVLAYWHRPLVWKHDMSMDMEAMLSLAFMVVQKVASYIKWNKVDWSGYEQVIHGVVRRVCLE